MFSIEINLFLPVNANTNWLIKLAAYFCHSLLITGRVYIILSNDKSGLAF
jgi:hypothetical protein